jgi:hypothetical protein
MNTFTPFAQRAGFVIGSRLLAVAMIVGIAVASPSLQADPGDFAAMPGLWKIVTTRIDHGHRGKSVLDWHCVDEGADPWTTFAVIVVPDMPPCQREDQHRGSTSLAWTAHCGNANVAGRGRVDFDSAEHYTASVSLPDRGDVVSVEGQRMAACTSPSD